MQHNIYNMKMAFIIKIIGIRYDKFSVRMTWRLKDCLKILVNWMVLNADLKIEEVEIAVI